MQRRAAAAYVALFLIVAASAYVVTATATPPTVSVDAAHELQQGDNVTVDGTEYNVSELRAGDGGSPQATIEWSADNETRTTETSEGETVTLGDTEYVAHFPDGETLQLTADRQSYRNQVQERERFFARMNSFNTVAIMSGLTAVLLLALAYTPVRR